MTEVLQVTGSMTAVVKNMDRAMSEMNLEKVSSPPLLTRFCSDTLMINLHQTTIDRTI
jgi:spore maturation protein SpmB